MSIQERGAKALAVYLSLSIWEKYKGLIPGQENCPETGPGALGTAQSGWLHSVLEHIRGRWFFLMVALKVPFPYGSATVLCAWSLEKVG